MSDHRATRLLLALLAIALPAPAVGRAAPPSPYVALGAQEKIQWRPWGEEAFAEAQAKGLPVLLDIGTIWCHYCQVMSGTTWRDEGVAENVNQYFLPIKVDRDEHPEVDARFQAILLEIRKMGGWPLTGFLTEEGRMFAGATYLPPTEDKDGRPGLKMVAERYGKDFQAQKRGYHNTAEEVANRFVQAAQGHRSGSLDGFAEAIARGIALAGDPVKGGFGSGAKFPEYSGFRFALERGALGDPELERLARETLDGMADGGIRDLLGGGFHRASVDRQWRVPRFEKLLGVNAGLLELYSEAARLTRSERYRRIAGETLDYLLRTLADRGAGGFHAAQAADRDHTDNGSTYTWTLEEIRSRLPGDAAKVAQAYFGLVAEPGLVTGQPKANVLAAVKTIEDAAREVGIAPEKAQKLLGEVVTTLRATRATRPEPGVDPSKYASLNGLAAHALLVAAPVLGRDDARDQALRTLDLFLAQAWNDKTGFARGLRGGVPIGEGLLQDQVFLAQALVDAYEATGARRYLEAAERTIDLALHRFEDRALGRLLDLPVVGAPSYSALVIPDYPVQDTLIPGENATAALVLARLERLNGDPGRLERARKLIGAFAGSARSYGPNAATLATAADRVLDPPPRLIVIGDQAPVAAALVDAARVAPRRPAVLRFAARTDVPAALVVGEVGAAIEKGSGTFAVVDRGRSVAGPLAAAPDVEAALRAAAPPAQAPSPGLSPDAAAAAAGSGK